MPLKCCNGCSRTFPAEAIKRGRCLPCRREYERRKGSSHQRG